MFSAPVSVRIRREKKRGRRPCRNCSARSHSCGGGGGERPHREEEARKLAALPCSTALLSKATLPATCFFLEQELLPFTNLVELTKSEEKRKKEKEHSASARNA